MYSMKKNDGKEYNTAKGVSNAAEFNKFKDVLFNETIIRHKMNRIQTKKHKLGTYKINKISFSCFGDKRYVLDDGIYTLSYFHKNSIISYNNRKRLWLLKKIMIIKKDCDYWKRLWLLKKIMIIEKDSDYQNLVVI